MGFFFWQIKDILKGSLRFNQSQLESEDNEEITIADDHYCSSQYSTLKDERNLEGLSTNADDSTSSQLQAPEQTGQQGETVVERKEEILHTENVPAVESQVRHKPFVFFNFV